MRGGGADKGFLKGFQACLKSEKEILFSSYLFLDSVCVLANVFDILGKSVVAFAVGLQIPFYKQKGKTIITTLRDYVNTRIKIPPVNLVC